MEWTYLDGFGERYQLFSDGRIVVTATQRELRSKRIGNSEQYLLYNGEKHKAATKAKLLARYFGVKPTGGAVESLPNEQWREVVGTGGRYMVSSLGRVKRVNLPYVGERLIKQHQDRKGALVAYITSGEQKGNYTVSSLMGKAFLANPKALPMVVHLNGVKTDNRLENLKWVHNSEAQQLAVDLKLKVAKKGQENATSRGVDQYSADGLTFIKRWGCLTDVERELGVAHPNISKVCRGKRATAGGYSWRYIEEENED